jgi:hypothetical protein
MFSAHVVAAAVSYLGLPLRQRQLQRRVAPALPARELLFCQNGNTLFPMKTLTVKVADGLFAEIASAARARNMPKSEIVRERLTHKAVAKCAKGSLWSRMEDLVIHSDSLPADLSSNKAHLKNYGQNRRHR